MKKAWIFVILALLLAGCRENYLAEKEFYKASETLNKLKTSASARSIQAYDSAIKSFEHIWEKYPGSPKAADSLFIISNIYLSQKDYQAARGALQKVAQNFTGSRACDARFAIAQSYELEGNWREAEKAYWETADYHPLEIKGLYAPIQVIIHYKKLKALEAKAEAYQKATEHYRTILKQVGPIQTSARIRNYIALAHLIDGKRTKAKQEWLSIAKDFPKNSFAPLAILAAADASAPKGVVSDESLLLYQKFLKDYPKHSLAGKISIRLGLAYLKKKDFANARLWLTQAQTKYFNKNAAQTADVKLLLAKTYEQEGNWIEAENIYMDIEQHYSNTVAALQAPFLIASHYESAGEKTKVSEVLEGAIHRYEGLAKDKSNSELSRYAKLFLNSAYAKNGDWDKVLMSIDEAMLKETNANEQGQWLLLKALISEKRLHDKEKARVLYQDFLKNYSDHPLARVAKSHIEALTAS